MLHFSSLLIWLEYHRKGFDVGYQDKMKKMIVLSSYITWNMVLLVGSNAGGVSGDCGDGCVNCVDVNNCTACSQGYRIEQKTCVSCPEKCLNCSADGSCSLCKNPFYGPLHPNICNLTCPANCDARGCAVDGKCFGCQNTYYGEKCSQNCELCLNNSCNFSSCIIGCKPGYFQISQSEPYKDCSACEENCDECFNYTHCKQCKNGYFLVQANFPCVGCSSLAANCTSCSYKAGASVCESCETGFTLTSINQCVPTCCADGCGNNCSAITTYTTTTTTTTTTTKTTMTTMTATPSLPLPPPPPTTTTVIPATSTTKIDSSTLSLIEITTAPNRAVSTKVSSGTTNAQKSSSVKTDFSSYPTLYELTSLRTSNTETSGTNAVFTNISHTRNLAAGSTTTFTHSSVDSENSVTDYTQSGDKDTNLDIIIIIIAAASAGGVILLVLLGLGICCFKKHSRKHVSQAMVIEEVDETESFVNPVFERQCEENLSTTTVRATEADKSEPIYAKPNKQRISEVGTKGKVVDIKVNVYTVEDDLEKNKNEDYTARIGRLERLDEDIPIVIKAGTQSTYYNTEGIKRSRIPVKKLVTYIKDKKDYESEFDKLPKGLIRTFDEAVKPANMHKNRFDQIFAYDATRVVMRNGEYINANYVDGYDVPPAYIACLGPVKSAMNDFRTFWEMVWQEKSSKIVMLTKLVEGKNMKCEQYWPDDGCTKRYGNISVKTATETVYAEFILRELLLNNGTEVRRATHYHYTAWPDKTVPDSVVSLVEFRDAVETSKTTNSGPMITHCSAGIGRTGTYIALDILIKEGLAEDSVDIFDRVMALRGQRAHMVQNVDQYIYLHHAVAYALTCASKPLDISSLPSAMTDSKIQEQFQNLQSLTLFPKTDLEAVAKNKRKNANRKGADIPGDRHRVKLKTSKNDYINAVYIDGYRQINKYIAAQSPLPNHIEQFVSMLYEENITCIVDLEDEQSSSKDVGQYIPATDKIIKLSHFQIKCVRCDEDDRFTFKELTLSKRHTPSDQDKTIKYYQMKGWRREECLPENEDSFLHLLSSVYKDNISQKGCILVQCLTGANKGGLFCALSLMLEKLTVEKELSVVNAVCQVRRRRHSAVENIDQFKFCYRCIQSYLEKSDSKTYYNIL